MSDSEDDVPLGSLLKSRLAAKSKKRRAESDDDFVSTTKKQRKKKERVKKEDDDFVEQKKAVGVPKTVKKSETQVEKTQKKVESRKPKKEFAKAGQKFDTPNSLDVLRLFYESLYNEESKSKVKDEKRSTALSMAERWCMERGLFDQVLQEKLWNRLQAEKSKSTLKVKAEKKKIKSESRDV